MTLSRRQIVFGAAASATVTSMAWPTDGQARRPTGERPNILFITMDELKPDAFGASGNRHIFTPTIDGLAARGALFANTYCQGPLSQPARASLITGQYVKTTGTSWNRKNMDPEWPTVMKALQAAGYTTAIIGKTLFAGRVGQTPNAEGIVDLSEGDAWTKKFGVDDLVEEFDHEIHKPMGNRSPYTKYLEDRGLLERYRAEMPSAAASTRANPFWRGGQSALQDEDSLSGFLAEQSADWLRDYDGKKPFFLWASFIAPHPPVMTSHRWYDLYKNAVIPTGVRDLPQMPENAWGGYLKAWTKMTMSADMTDAEALNMARAYYGLVSQVDNRIGLILKALKDRGLDRNTWIVFSADHGEMLGNHNLVYKNVFYRDSVQVPNVIVPPHGMTPRRIETPVQSIDITATFVDLAGATMPSCRGASLLPMLGGQGAGHEAVFSELAGLGGQGNYFVMTATDRYRYTYDKLNKIDCELFDLKNDPDELRNLADDSDYAKLRNDLRGDLVLPFIGA